MNDRLACRRCGALLSAYRLADEPEGLCAACAAAEAAPDEWRVLDPRAPGPGRRRRACQRGGGPPGERIHVQAELETRGILADHIEVHLAVDKLRAAPRMAGHRGRRPGGLPLSAWPFRFSRGRR